MKNILKNFFYLEDEAEDDTMEQTTPKKEQHPQQPQQVAKQVPNQQMQQVVTTPMATPRKQQQQRKMQPVPKNTNQVTQMYTEEQRTNLVSFTQTTSKVNLFEPRVYSEAQDIAECIRNKKTAVVNLQRIDKENGKRIIDFLSGTVFALNGEIKKIGIDIFLCTPDNVEIDGAISEHYYDAEQY
ncbi:cell division protein SepF [Kurthia senegalensis]|uniref:cell division protein SepF n=1 Tax=Kurthia senegalensis TaxID=1033740 RepID=UPI000289E302|nr:cell division protein SepF [Kurthia senegalensis]